MGSSSAAEIEKLRREIRRHDRLYYVLAAPEISDLEYDRLMDRLKKLEAAHPELVTPDSPTQRIGDQPISSLTQVVHRVPMLSIDNTYSIEELREYGQRAARIVPGEPIEWVVELKIDGVAVSVTYEDGLLARAVTRGDGRRRRRHDPQYPHGRRRSAPSPRERRAAGAGSPWRSLHDQFRPGAAQRRASPPGGEDVCQHAERGGGQHPVARSAAVRPAAAADVLPWRRLRRRLEERQPHGLPGRDRRLRPAADAAGPSVPDVRRGGRALPSARSSDCTNSISKSTGWCSR